jgi:hypothetical protein
MQTPGAIRFMMPNHALQRTRPSHRGCNRTPSLGRVAELGSLGRVSTTPHKFIFARIIATLVFALIVYAITVPNCIVPELPGISGGVA